MADLIDTHCHLAHGRLRERAQAVLHRARAAGVEWTICAAGGVHESRTAVTLADRHDSVACTAGVHPHEAAHPGGDHLRIIEELAARAKNVAVGEIGLDYHYGFSPRADQQRVFAEQLALARRLDKPVVVHTREAFDETMAILGHCRVDCLRVVFHSFTGDARQARQALDSGATISFSGIVTFKKSADIRAAAAIVPAERLLIETDSPYLSPEPVRKMKTNEPCNVPHVAACLAAVRGVAPEAVAEITTANAVRFFGLDGLTRKT